MRFIFHEKNACSAEKIKEGCGLLLKRGTGWLQNNRSSRADTGPWVTGRHLRLFSCPHLLPGKRGESWLGSSSLASLRQPSCQSQPRRKRNPLSRSCTILLRNHRKTSAATVCASMPLPRVEKIPARTRPSVSCSAPMSSGSRSIITPNAGDRSNKRSRICSGCSPPDLKTEPCTVISHGRKPCHPASSRPSNTRERRENWKSAG